LLAQSGILRQCSKRSLSEAWRPCQQAQNDRGGVARLKIQLQ
jgi:hypothetical protein